MQNDQRSGLSLDEIAFIFMLFAYDVVILGKDRDDLPKSLDRLEHYCNKWGLQVNTEKTNIIVFRKRGGLWNNEYWTYKGDNLEVVNNLTIWVPFLIILGALL